MVFQVVVVKGCLGIVGAWEAAVWLVEAELKVEEEVEVEEKEKYEGLDTGSGMGH